MPFCPECGKSVSPKAKFCRNCGASLAEDESATPSSLPETSADVPAAPQAAPVTPAQPPEENKTEPVSTAPAKARPSRKKAAAVAPAPKISEEPAVVQEAPVQPVTEELPSPSAQPAGRICESCGNPLKPGDKFCGKCCARVVEDVVTEQPVTATVEPVVKPIVEEPKPASVSSTPAEGAHVCRSCGNPLKFGDKFCGKCCARVVEDSVAEQPMVVTGEPAVKPVVEEAIAPSVSSMLAEGAHVCRSCGNPLKPGDKFCGKCCARVAEEAEAEQPVTATAVPCLKPVVEEHQEPSVPPAQPEFDGRKCPSCGNLLSPGDKFCAKCCAKVPDEVSQQVHRPEVTEKTISTAQCPSCGSAVTGNEKFCGICGTSLAKPTVEESTSQPQKIPAFCSNCGQPLVGNPKFCGSCGSPVHAEPGPVKPSMIPKPQASPGTDERVVGVIGNAKKMKMLGASWDTYSIIVTDQRMILAQMTQEMINTAVKEAQSRAKEEGKGLLSQMMHQMSAMFQYSQRYYDMPPEKALTENPANKAIGNRSISAINMKVQESGSGGAEYSEFRMVIEGQDGKYEFMIAEDERFTNLLKEVYGDKLHMPIGYFSKAGMRIKLF